MRRKATGVTGKMPARKATKTTQERPTEARNMEDIAQMFRTMHFARKWIGGIEERDVWKQLDEVQAQYRAVYNAQRERDLAIIRERDAEIRRLKKRISELEVFSDDDLFDL